ncbi:MAG: glycogen synthase GlgA [Clostridia bacterium]
MATTKSVEKDVKKPTADDKIKKNTTVKSDKPTTCAKKPCAKKEASVVANTEEKVVAKTESKVVAKAENNTNAKTKVLFATSEAAPFIRSGGLGDVAYALPKFLNKSGVDCRVILPMYYDIPASFRNTMQYVGSVYVTLAWRHQYCGVFMYKIDGTIYYFIDNEYYFKRNGLYGHYDDAERFAFFSKACLEVLNLINFYPNVIHCNDWHTALIPVFLDCFYREVENYKFMKTIFTIHNIEFQGKYGKGLLQDILGLPVAKASLVEFGDCINFMKGGIECCNLVTTVSETYAKEIEDSFYSYGLDSILKAREFKIKGVINGIDTNVFDPETDKALFKNYSADKIAGKALNKEGLCKMVNLPYFADKPIISMVTRLTEQKGIDLVMAVLEEILSQDVQMVILGKGDWKYETALKEMQNKYPNKLSVIINFSQDIASKIYAGSDIFLMPSKFEPCGLSQMIAMRYGSIPVVRETGGLKDSVAPFNPVTGEGLGFSFYSYNAYDMLDAIKRAVNCFTNKANWDKIIQNAMNFDFSWKNSANKYIEIYKNL